MDIQNDGPGKKKVSPVSKIAISGYLCENFRVVYRCVQK